MSGQQIYSLFFVALPSLLSWLAYLPDACPHPDYPVQPQDHLDWAKLVQEARRTLDSIDLVLSYHLEPLSLLE